MPILQLFYLPIREMLLPLHQNYISMIENIEFEAKGQNQSEIRLQHSTGETTTLLFSSVFPMQAQEYYLKAINALVKQKPDLSPKDDLFSVFTGWFLRYSLEMPLGVGTSKNEERIRIGNRIKETEVSQVKINERDLT